MDKPDVVIIGLGAAGGIAAYVLAKAGLKVLALEAGPYLSSADFVHQLDELGTVEQARLGDIKFNKEMPTWRPNSNVPASSPAVALPMINAVGGSSIHYGAWSWRLAPTDFRIRTATTSRYGSESLPWGSVVADWPVSYEQLEAYYDRIEHTIGVCGRGGKNPFEGPRSRDYPMPPLRLNGFSTLAAKAMRAMGYHPFTQPAAITSVNWGGRAACSYCGFCGNFGCWNDSKSSSLVTVIRDAEATGNLEIRPLSAVTRIATGKDGRVTGVYYRSSGIAEPTFQPTKFVILSSYVYENVRRLLLSRSDVFPRGLCNEHGQVGRYYISHTYYLVRGLFSGRKLNLFNGAAAQGTAMDDFNADNFDHSGLGFIRGASVSTAHAAGLLPIAVAKSVPPGIPTWGAMYKKWLRDDAGSVGELAAQMETLPYESNFIDLDDYRTDPWGDPVARVTFSLHENESRMGAYLDGKLAAILRKMGATQTWTAVPGTPLPINNHAYGGTRMGSDPKTSVVDRHSIAHEVPNLAILGGSTFPSSSGYNPTETIQALSWYSAEYIAAHFSHLTATT